MNDDAHAVIQALRAQGYAVVIFSADELEELIGPKELESNLVSHANEVLEDLAYAQVTYREYPYEP